MNRKLLLSVLAAILMLALPVIPLAAQTLRSPAPLIYVMPQGADPQRFDFGFDGQFFDIPGSVFLPDDTHFLGGGGAEFHAGPDFLGAFTQLKITGNYTGGISITSAVGTGFEAFTPWGVSPVGVVTPPDPVFLTAQEGSALIGEFDPDLQRYFSLLFVQDLPEADIPAFRDSLFRVQAFVSPQAPGVVPEPDALAIAAGMLVSCLPLLRRRHRRAA